MLKRYILLLPMLFLNFSALAEINCPTYKNLSACLDAAKLQFESEKNSMSDYLHDKDNLTDRSYAFTMLNVIIPKRYADDNERCQNTCPN